jgi:2-hydroxy-3-keto-5-methylthiopentenyl-1-phosphate phosphatase
MKLYYKMIIISNFDGTISNIDTILDNFDKKTRLVNEQKILNKEASANSFYDLFEKLDYSLENALN